MGQTVDEQLSALLDGEVPVEQQELLLRRLDRDTDLRARFGRYSMIGDLLTDPRPQVPALLIADRVRERLAEEDAAAPVGRHRNAIGAGLLGAGFAAAAAVIVALNLNSVRDPDATPALASVAPTPIQEQQPEPQRARIAPERMTRYLITHAQYTNAASRQFVDSHLVMPAYQRAAWQTTGAR